MDRLAGFKYYCAFDLSAYFQQFMLAELHERTCFCAQFTDSVRPKADIVDKIPETLAARELGQRLSQLPLGPEASVNYTEGKALIAPNLRWI